MTAIDPTRVIKDRSTENRMFRRFTVPLMRSIALVPHEIAEGPLSHAELIEGSLARKFGREPVVHVPFYLRATVELIQLYQPGREDPTDGLNAAIEAKEREAPKAKPSPKFVNKYQMKSKRPNTSPNARQRGSRQKGRSPDTWRPKDRIIKAPRPTDSIE